MTGSTFHLKLAHWAAKWESILGPEENKQEGVLLDESGSWILPWQGRGSKLLFLMLFVHLALQSHWKTAGTDFGA